MKNGLFRGILAVAVAGMGIASAGAAETGVATNQPEATVKALYAAFGAGDMTKILSLISPQVVWAYHAPSTLIPFAGTYRGQKGVSDFFTNDAKYVEVKGNDVNMFMVDGDKVAVFGEEHGVVRKTGKKFGATWVHVFVVKDKHIVGFDEYIDSAAIYLAMR